MPATELSRTRGFEEGMIEGLARLATGEWAAMQILEASYDYYVRAYEALARVLRIEVEQFWRALWIHPVGEVRLAFVGVVDVLRERAMGGGLSLSERSRLQGLADQIFSSGRSGLARPDEATLERTWEVVFR